MLQQPAPLTVQGVLGTLRALAAEQGKGAAGRRQRTVLGLLRSCRESEPKYLVRTLVRVGEAWFFSFLFEMGQVSSPSGENGCMCTVGIQLQTCCGR